MLNLISIGAIVRVLADDQLMYQGHELHLLLQESFEIVVCLFIVVSQVLQVLVGRDEQLVAHLVLQMDTEGFDAVAHGVRGCDSREVGQGLEDGSLFRWFLEVFI